MKNQYQMLSGNESRLLLNDKVTAIFGAGGAIGSQVAREFSHEGATIFLSGRRLDSVEKVAKEIRPPNGKADAREVDALDEKAVNDYLDYVIEQAGRIDIVFNAVGPQPIEFDNGKSTMELSFEKFVIPMNTYVASNFLTARSCCASHAATAFRRDLIHNCNSIHGNCTIHLLDRCSLWVLLRQ